MSAEMRVLPSRKPTPIRAIGSLLIAPNGVARRLLNVCRDAFDDITAAWWLSRNDDAEHDTELELALAAIARRDGQAARAHVIAAQMADAREDARLSVIPTTSKRLSGCIEKVFSARKRGAATRRGGRQG